MAFKGVEMVLSAVLMTLLFAGSVTAQSQSGCTTVIISLSPCLDYITGNSSTPSSSCCSQLTTVVRSQPQCLCQVLSGGGSSLGLNINQTQALALPGACKVQTPPLSRCNTGSPVSSPPGTSDSDSDSPTTPAGPGEGSKTVPSTGGDTSHGTATKLPFSLLFLSSLAVAIYGSI